MATWEDVKAAAAKQADTDAKVIAYLADVKAKLADLASKPAGPSADELAAVADELNKGADDVIAAMAPPAADPAP